MSIWIKICANTSLADARLAVDAGADAVGFIFAPSPRRVKAEDVAVIVSGLPAQVEKIGVFVDADFEEIAVGVRHCGLTGVQLHSEDTTGLAQRLRDEFGAGLRILRVIHFAEDAAVQLRRVSVDDAVDAVLVDSRTPSAVGGTGTAFDWAAARASVFAPGSPLKLVAAGGLSPMNVADAIQILAPWGVDVASGVELSPGIKDPGKVQDFVARAREAALI